MKDLYNNEMKGESERLWINDDCAGMRFSIAMSMGFLLMIDNFLVVVPLDMNSIKY